MGAIEHILSHRQLPDRERHNSRMFVDLSENVHIHFRDLRLMFGVDEFFEFTGIVKDSVSEIRRYLKRHPEYKEQEVFEELLIAGGWKRQTTPLQRSPQPHQSKYFPNRLHIELQKEGVIDPVHVHFRDYRLVMNIETFREFSLGIKEALDNLEEFLKKHDYNQELHPFRRVVTQTDWPKSRLTLWDRVKYKVKKFRENINRR